MLRLTAEVRDQMFAHALAELPNEACGMFSALDTARFVDEFHPMSNAAESPMLFALDGQEMLDLEQAVEGSGRSLIGVMHSHTATSPYPSPTDVRDITRFDPFTTFHHIIVSLRQAEPVLRCFQLRDEEIIEIPVEVSAGDGRTEDSGGEAAIAAVVPLPRSD